MLLSTVPTVLSDSSTHLKHYLCVFLSTVYCRKAPSSLYDDHDPISLLDSQLLARQITITSGQTTPWHQSAAPSTRLNAQKEAKREAHANTHAATLTGRLRCNAWRGLSRIQAFYPGSANHCICGNVFLDPPYHTYNATETKSNGSSGMRGVKKASVHGPEQICSSLCQEGLCWS